MILSALIARGRIARKERPSFIAAWGLVAADFASTTFALYGAWSFWITGFGLPFGLMKIITALFLGGFVPLQIVLITSTIYAVKSRWIEHDEEAC